MHFRKYKLKCSFIRVQFWVIGRVNTILFKTTSSKYCILQKISPLRFLAVCMAQTRAGGGLLLMHTIYLNYRISMMMTEQRHTSFSKHLTLSITTATKGLKWCTLIVHISLCYHMATKGRCQLDNPMQNSKETRTEESEIIINCVEIRPLQGIL